MWVRYIDFVFCFQTPYSLVDFYQRFEEEFSEDGGGMFLQNVGNLLQNYRRHNPEDHSWHLHGRENFKSLQVGYVAGKVRLGYE